MKLILFGVFLIFIIFHGADCSGDDEWVTVKGGFSIIGTIKKVIAFPLKIVIAAIKLPITILEKVLVLPITLTKELNTVGSKLAVQVVAAIEQIFKTIIDILVNVGVFQGKTAEDVYSGIKELIEKIITFVAYLVSQVNATIIGSISTIFNTLKIKDIVIKIASLPLIKQIVELKVNLIKFVTTNFGNQIDKLISLIKEEYTNHIDFFKPILDGLSSRILIITNAIQALVNGKLSECPGLISKADEPSQGLLLELNIWIDEIKIILLKLVGFPGLADVVEAQVDELGAALRNSTT